MSTISKKQQEFLDWEMGVFFHFGIRTFYEGHKDWDMQEMPLQGFNPTELNCEQWIRTIKEAGAKYAILVCKHHDGFANWPSKYTDYSVKNTPWKDGNGDVVAEFVAACRKYDVKVGLYYSPAQFGSKDCDNKQYDDYFINQIGELLTNYGKIDYLWFDGCGSEGHTYDTKRIIKAIRTMQKDILIFNMWDPDTRWVGNEFGMAPWPLYNSVSSLNFSVLTEEKDKLAEERYLPAECDFKIRKHNWFYSENDADMLMSLDELVGRYYYTVGRGANFLVNIGPDRRGLLPEQDCARFLEFGREIQRRFANPLPASVQRKDKMLQITFDKEILLDTLVLKEDLTKEPVVSRFTITTYTDFGKPITIFEGNTIGHKMICTFPTVATKCLQVQLDQDSQMILDAACFYTK